MSDRLTLEELQEKWGRKYSKSHDLWKDIDTVMETCRRDLAESERLREEAELNYSITLTGFRASEEALKNSEQLRKEAESAIEADRSVIADFVTRLNKAISSRFWLTEGRGSYEWDDDRYREEFHAAVTAINKVLAPMIKLAANIANSPKTSAEVVAARVDKDQQIATLEAEKVALVEALQPFADAEAKWMNNGDRIEIRMDWLTKAREVLSSDSAQRSIDRLRKLDALREATAQFTKWLVGRSDEDDVIFLNLHLTYADVRSLAAASEAVFGK